MPSAFCVWGIVRLILSFAAVDDAQSQQTDTQEHHGGGFGDLLEKLVLPAFDAFGALFECHIETFSQF